MKELKKELKRVLYTIIPELVALQELLDLCILAEPVLAILGF